MTAFLSSPPTPVATLLIALGVCLAVFALWFLTRLRLAARTVGRAETDAAQLLREAEREAATQSKELLLSAKEQALELVTAAERNAHTREAGALQQERRLEDASRAAAQRQTTVTDAEQALSERETQLARAEASVAAIKIDYEQLIVDHRRELNRLAGMTTEEAKDVLVRQVESEARRDAAHLVKRLEHEAREAAAEKAKQIITKTIQRSAPEHAIETTVSVVDLPSDDLKGRIIGREGRNIRALELATGVELIINDTPDAIIVSNFDPLRRAVAKQAIEQLVADGRIHPARIEEVVERVRAEVNEAAVKDGESTAFELGLHDMHPEIHRLMGRLKFRTSYRQNVLSHSKEVAFLAGIMARELGLNADVSVRAAFVHDIGKAMNRELQGTHLELGIEFLRQHGESDAVVDAMAAHHMDIDWPSLEAMLVQAADAISAARPGARRDILETYIKCLENLEGIAESFKGASKAFALQAGREIRIMVESEHVSDEKAVWSQRMSPNWWRTNSNTPARSRSPSSEKPSPSTTLDNGPTPAGLVFAHCR